MKKLLYAMLAFLGSCMPAAAQQCTYYASPDGHGNGLSERSPFQIRNFWAVAEPGSTLCLLDGTYRGDASMIDPSSSAHGLSGTRGAPITVRALNDGGVTIDGQFARIPVHLSSNDWWVLEGFNAKNGTHSVIYATNGADNNVIRRVVGWDTAADMNSAIIGIHKSSNWLIEDVAAFGVGRKTLSASQGGNSVTCRRCWLRWEGSIYAGVLGTTTTYNNYHFRCENCLTTWSGESMPQTYISVPNGEAMTGFESNVGTGILTVDRNDGDKCARVEVLGSISYVNSTDRLPTGTAGGAFGPLSNVWTYGLSCVHLKHVAAVVSPQHPRFNFHRAFVLSRGTSGNENITCAPNCSDLSASNLTSIVGSAGNIVHDVWDVQRHVTGTSLSVVQGLGADAWTGSAGARVCNRWENGVVTDAPLWPWPMNDRIKLATATAGSYSGPCPTCVGGRAPRRSTDVTANLEELLGDIPASCRH